VSAADGLFPTAWHMKSGRAIGQPRFRAYMLLNPSMM
jgi:hypothetical protein